MTPRLVKKVAGGRVETENKSDEKKKKKIWRPRWSSSKLRISQLPSKVELASSSSPNVCLFSPTSWQENNAYDSVCMQLNASRRGKKSAGTFSLKKKKACTEVRKGGVARSMTPGLSYEKGGS